MPWFIKVVSAALVVVGGLGWYVYYDLSHRKDKSRMPELSHDILARDYPVLYQSMFQLVHTTGERINKIFAGRQDGK